MSRPDLEAINARCEAATGGDWTYSIDVETEKPCTLFSDFDGDEIDIAVFETWDATGYDEEMLGNAQFIAHARKDLPDCTAEIERLRKACRMAYQGLYTYDDEASQKAIALIDTLETGP